MAKIAVELERALAHRRARGVSGGMAPRVVARGSGWSVADVVCTCGPHDRSFEEQHSRYTIAVVVAGSFQYRCALGRALMTPGSLMLGNYGQPFECGHEHGEGDRCVSFWYSPEYFERLAAGSGARATRDSFTVPRLPPLRALSPLVTRATLGLAGDQDCGWEEVAIDLAAGALRMAGKMPAAPAPTAAAERRVSRTVRLIDRQPTATLTLQTLARAAGLSPYHFLRTFVRLTGVTPHQYVLRARLREAAIRVATESGRILDIALDCGFGDISNFNRAFRREFGLSPRDHRSAVSL